MMSEAHALTSEDARGMQQVIERLPMPVLLEGLSGGMLLCNDAARRQLAQAALDPVPGGCVTEVLRKWVMRVSAGAPDQVQAQTWNAWLGAATDVPLLAADRDQCFELRRAAIPALGHLWTIADISAHKRLERELRRNTESLEQRVLERTQALDHARQAAQQANLSKTRFFAAASHDLLQPLNAARIFASTLSEQPDLSPAGRLMAERIDIALRSAEEVIDVLVDVARLDTGAVRPTFEDVDLEDLLRGLLDQFGSVSHSRKLRLRLGSCRYLVRSDRRLLRRVLQNLISNALRYTARGGVLVGVRRCGGNIRLDVVDTGLGIASEKLPRAFEEFQRVGTGSPWGERGLGLGLAICARICHLLGHRLSAQSREGRGSRFSVEFAQAWRKPVAAGAPCAIPVAPPAPALALRVLCVDDDEQALQAMQLLLAGWGAEVAVASSRAAAEGAMQQRQFDALIVDFQFDGDPANDGLSLIARLREIQALRPPHAILLTADRSSELAAAAAGAGIPVLHKPMRAARLRALLEAVRRR